MATQDLSQATAAEASKTNTSLRMGTVTAVSGTGATVNVNGASVGPLPVLGSYVPAVGDVVAVLRQDASWLILGASTPTPNGISNIQVTGTGQTFSSTNVTLNNSTMTFTKRAGGTNVLVTLIGSGWASTGSGFAFAAGVNIGNLGNQDIVFFLFNPASQHLTFGGERLLSGLNAGTYSVSLYGRTGTANAVTVDSNDRWSATVREV